ncbi:expressed unknown protein [Seminavis robusta]|uniref:Uncharacterized protein n=1 Tax=Seminavis robusta TaxID=568900 RepID=A0A9N8HXJ5_9STRA|nr:expressed unknown protein [Seminavis robusta]|eukprot:Sro3145_g344420.1 n/a (380) ;mRNA; f:7476-8615
MQTLDAKTKKLLGQVRIDKEVQQLGCLLMVTGFPEIVQPLTWIAGLINGGKDEFGDPITVTTGLPFSTLFGYLCCVLIGVLALFVGYAAAFHNAGNKRITLAVSIFVQTAYILTVSTCMNVTRVASKGSNFDVPLGSISDQDDLPEPNAKLLASMGVIAIIAYWFGMLGSISLLLGSLQKFQEGKPEERPASYYQGRLLFYSFVLFLGGMAQLVVGAHLEWIYKLGGGPLPNGAFVKVAMLLIRYPSLAMTVGAVQIFNAIWGMLRYFGIMKPKDGGAFVCSVWFGWFVQLVLQIMVQPSILPGATAARAPPTLTAFAFGMNFMPAFLDSKAGSLPNETEIRDYYGLDPTKGDTENDTGSFVDEEQANASQRFQNVQDC